MRDLKHEARDLLDKQRTLNNRVLSEKREYSPQEDEEWELMDSQFNEIMDRLKEERRKFPHLFGTEGPVAGGEIYQEKNMKGNSKFDKIERRGAIHYKPEELEQYLDGCKEDREIVEQWGRYLRYGAHGLNADEFRNLQADLGVAGGFLVSPTKMAQGIIRELNNSLFMRRRCQMYICDDSHSFSMPMVDSSMGDVTYTSELLTGSEDEELDFNNRVFVPHPCARRIRVSNTLLQIANYSVPSLINEEFAYAFGRVLENAYLQGNGAGQPLGIFTASDAGISTNRDVTSSLSASLQADDLHDVLGALKSQYRAGATWIMHRDLETRIRKWKDGEGNYLYQPSFSDVVPGRLLGYEVLVSEYAPNSYVGDAYILAFGNLREYVIVDGQQLSIQVLVELYSETNQTGYIGRMSTDGCVRDENAFVRLQLGS